MENQLLTDLIILLRSGYEIRFVPHTSAMGTIYAEIQVIPPRQTRRNDALNQKAKSVTKDPITLFQQTALVMGINLYYGPSLVPQMIHEIRQIVRAVRE